MTRPQTRFHNRNVLCKVVALAGLSLLTLASQASGETTVPVTSSPTTIKLSTLSLAGIPQHNETLGNPRAPVKMLYFDDPQCPICLEWHTQVMPALVRKYVRTGKLQIQWHGFAVIGPASVTGERFIAAAGLQNHLWNVLDDVMANQGQENSGWLNAPLLEQIGASIPGFNVSAAIAAASSPAVTQELATDLQEGENRGIDGVPAILYGRRGGPLKFLEFTEYTPADFERPINRLLRDTGGR
jgi:protein-disulfide isomerase